MKPSFKRTKRTKEDKYDVEYSHPVMSDDEGEGVIETKVKCLMTDDEAKAMKTKVEKIKVVGGRVA